MFQVAIFSVMRLRVPRPASTATPVLRADAARRGQATSLYPPGSVTRIRAFDGSGSIFCRSR